MTKEPDKPPAEEPESPFGSEPSSQPIKQSNLLTIKSKEFWKLLFTSGIVGAAIVAVITGIPLYMEIGLTQQQLAQNEKSIDILNGTLQVAKESLEKKPEIFMYVDPVDGLQMSTTKLRFIMNVEGVSDRQAFSFGEQLILIENETYTYDIYLSNAGTKSTFLISYAVNVYSDNENNVVSSDPINPIKEILDPADEPIKITYKLKTEPDMSPSGQIEFKIRHSSASDELSYPRIDYLYARLSDLSPNMVLVYNPETKEFEPIPMNRP